MHEIKVPNGNYEDDRMQIQQTYKYIVGFDVCMHYVTFPQEAQRKKELLCIRADGANVQSNIFAKAFNYITQVHTA